MSIKIKAYRFKALFLLGAFAVTGSLSQHSQAADREDVIAGVIVGVAAGYILAEHGDNLHMSYQYPYSPYHKGHHGKHLGHQQDFNDHHFKKHCHMAHNNGYQRGNNERSGRWDHWH